MKTSIATKAGLGLAAAAVISMSIPLDAEARGRHRHHHHHRGAAIGLVLGAAAVGAALAAPRYYYPPASYYSPPSYYYDQAPAYVEPMQPQSSNSWWYCRESNAYYPHVQSCPSAWQQVSPTPPASSYTPR